jgi:tetratricopeptide (TPR) repeat protein
MSLLVAVLVLTSVAVVSAAEPNTAGVDVFGAAKREFQSGKLDAALSLLDQAEKQSSPTPRSMDLRGSILMEQGKYDEAAKLFEAAKADPTTLAHLHLGDALRRQQKWEDARAEYRAAMRETDVLINNERLRFADFITYLGAKDEERARAAFERIVFPTESAAYYYAQAAWAFAHGNNRDGQNWIKKAEDIFPAKSTAWFARHLFDFGWLKTKPPLVAD